MGRGIYRGIAVAVLALLLSGCGSGGGDGSSIASSGTTAGPGDETSAAKAEYIKKGDAICKGIEAKYVKRLKNTPKSRAATALAEAAIPSFREAARELEELEALEGDEQQAQEIAEALAGAADELEEEMRVSAKEAEASLDEFDKLAKAYGLEVCGGL